VSGGGAVGSEGLFVAATTPGGPYVLTVASGAISATAMVTVVAKPVYKIGETNELATDDNPPADTAIAEQAQLAQSASIDSFSLFVKNAAGQVRFAIYDSTGPDNGPGGKLAETGAVDATAGWMTVPVLNSVILTSGTYWIAFDVSDGTIGLERDGNGIGNIASSPQTFGDGFPDTFSDMPDTTNDHHSFYATLTGL
jgi:hypothetical protein